MQFGRGAHRRWLGPPPLHLLTLEHAQLEQLGEPLGSMKNVMVWVMGPNPKLTTFVSVCAPTVRFEGDITLPWVKP